jgi:hypothetical protein
MDAQRAVEGAGGCAKDGATRRPSRERWPLLQFCYDKVLKRWLCVLAIVPLLTACEDGSDSPPLDRLPPDRARLILSADLPNEDDLILVARLETPVRVVTQERFGSDGDPEAFVLDVPPDEYKISAEIRRDNEGTDGSAQLLDVCHEFLTLEEGDVVELVVDGLPSECAIVYEAVSLDR